MGSNGIWWTMYTSFVLYSKHADNGDMLFLKPKQHCINTECKRGLATEVSNYTQMHANTQQQSFNFSTASWQKMHENNERHNMSCLINKITLWRFTQTTIQQVFIKYKFIKHTFIKSIQYMINFLYNCIHVSSEYGHRFDSRPFYFHVTTLSKFITPTSLCHQAVYFGTSHQAVIP